MACEGMIKKTQKFRIFFFCYFKNIIVFLSKHCFIGLKRQSEHSGLCLDTNSFVKDLRIGYTICYDNAGLANSSGHQKDVAI